MSDAFFKLLDTPLQERHCWDPYPDLAVEVSEVEEGDALGSRYAQWHSRGVDMLFRPAGTEWRVIAVFMYIDAARMLENAKRLPYRGDLPKGVEPSMSLNELIEHLGEPERRSVPRPNAQRSWAFYDYPEQGRLHVTFFEQKMALLSVNSFSGLFL
ncbi:MAG: hypothetical protein AAGH68_02010 [Pseudomonadota bacterium]